MRRTAITAVKLVEVTTIFKNFSQQQHRTHGKLK